jgi:uncharacterized protein RhaS with RHS repeats
MTCAVAAHAHGERRQSARRNTGFDYDNVGQLVATTMPDGSVLRYQYDAAHR